MPFPRTAAAILSIALVTFTLNACSDDSSKKTSAAPTTPTSTTASQATPTVSTTLISNTALISYTFTLSPTLAASSAAAAPLYTQASTYLATFAAEAAADQHTAGQSGYPYRPHSYQLNWQTTADTPRLLGAAAEGYVYTGGAHGSALTDGLIIDKTLQQPVSLTTLFPSTAGQQALTTAYCAALQTQIEQRTQTTLAQSGVFDACPNLTQQPATVVASGTPPTLSAIRVLLGDGTVGSHALGTFTVDVSLTNALYQHLAPAYR